MYLLDTNCLSESAAYKNRPCGSECRDLAALVPLSSMYISAITIFELQVGIARAMVRDPIKADRIKAWLVNAVLPGFDGRILAIDELIARAAGPLAIVRTSDTADVLIAATALVRRLRLVTRKHVRLRLDGR